MPGPYSQELLRAWNLEGRNELILWALGTPENFGGICAEITIYVSCWFLILLASWGSHSGSSPRCQTHTCQLCSHPPLPRLGFLSSQLAQGSSQGFYLTELVFCGGRMVSKSMRLLLSGTKTQLFLTMKSQVRFWFSGLATFLALNDTLMLWDFIYAMASDTVFDACVMFGVPGTLSYSTAFPCTLTAYFMFCFLMKN